MFGLLFPFTANEAPLPTSPSWTDGFIRISDPILQTTSTSFPNRVGNGSCIAFIKYVFSIKESLYTPKYLWEHWSDLGFKKTTLREGAIVITSEGYVWHVAIVERVEEDRFLITEQNFKPFQISQRWLFITDPNIIGYVSPQRL
jgi:hypothetical protein